MRKSEVSSPVGPVVGRCFSSPPNRLSPMLRSQRYDRPVSRDSRSLSLFRRILFVVLPLLVLLSAFPVESFAQKKGRPTATKTTRKKEAKRSTSSAPKSRRAAPAVEEKAVASAPKIFAPLANVSFPDSTVIEELADGVSLHRIRTPDDQVVNVVVLALSRGARLGTYKALDRQDGLETALDIKRRASSLLDDTVLVATNASFWSAASTSPIGPTVTEQEVMEIESYKAWSSLLIFDDGTATIDRIRLRGRVTWNGRTVNVDDVNRRGKEDGLIVYGALYGDSLPRGSRKSDADVVAEALNNRVDSSTDETEDPIDTAEVIRLWREEKLREDREHPLMKIVCEFPKPRRRRGPFAGPMVGQPMTLIVTAVDTGVVQIPERGYVISPGDRSTEFEGVHPGDTIRLEYTISPTPEKPVRHVLTGTPRLVRSGIADPEYETEGSKARRFVRNELARTAVGISRGGDTLFLVTIDSPCRAESRRGMTLSQLATLMQNLGAYDAMNFDGGGSTSMAVNDEMISRQGEGPSRRRVSNALLVMKKSAGRKIRRVTATGALGVEDGSSNR